MSTPLPKQHTQSLGRRTTDDVTIHLPVRWPAVGWALGSVALLVMAVLAAASVRTVTVPLIGAFALAYVLNPVVDLLVARRINRQVAIIGLMLLFAGAAALLGLVLGPRIYAELIEAPTKLSQVLLQLRPWVRQILDIELPDSIDSVLAALQVELSAHEDAPFASMARQLGEVVRVVFGGTVSALATMGSLAMVPLFVFAFLEHFHAICAGAISLWPPWGRQSLVLTLREIDTMLSSFVRGQLIVGSILAVLYSAGFFIVHLPLALLVGLVTGLGNMVPFVGTAVGLLAATSLSILSWRGWGHLMVVYAVFIVVHVLEAWVITPRVVGRRVGLSPFLVIVSVLVFGEMLGFFGILVAVPLAAVLKIIGKHALVRYRQSQFYRGNADGIADI